MVLLRCRSRKKFDAANIYSEVVIFFAARRAPVCPIWPESRVGRSARYTDALGRRTCVETIATNGTARSGVNLLSPVLLSSLPPHPQSISPSPSRSPAASFEHANGPLARNYDVQEHYDDYQFPIHYEMQMNSI